MTAMVLRWLLRLLTHALYRLTVLGREHVPARGGALLVSNHLSFVDAFLVGAAASRPIRFVMHRDYYARRWIHAFARALGMIPIASDQQPRELAQSLRAAREAVESGELVCIFAEGQVSRIGQMLPFQRGFEHIMRHGSAPIIPVCLDGVWGSVFSFRKGRFFWKIPRRIPYPVTVSFGQPMRPDASPFDVRQAIQELGSDAWPYRRGRMKPLPRALVQTARRHPFRHAMGDEQFPRITFGAALARSVFLARRLRAHWEGQSMVGIMLPPSVAGALVNTAAMLLGKIPVNLNYTLSGEMLAACGRQCGLANMVTSRAFLQRAKIEAPLPAVFLEDVAAAPRWTEMAAALVVSRLAPVRWLERFAGRGTPPGLDDVATVIFSSGSTGDPKGVMLTHYNLASNVEQIGQAFDFDARDRLLGVLPFFHSFGFTVTLVMPWVLGGGVVYHPTPLDARAVGELVQRHRVSFLAATPTFLQLYQRVCRPEQLGSLRFVMTGAEKLPERLAAAFEEKFGIRPLEGYGCTECAPVVAVNTHDYRAAGLRQVGGKQGKIGHPLPGVSVRIVDPGTGEPLPPGQAGLLLVRGPNVMRGYLDRPDKTAEALRDGWYVTGDIASLDEDGFLQITDRLSRFSKIGGEMVPHMKVEERLHELAGVFQQTFVVTGVPDPSRGERLVVLHTLGEDAVKGLLRRLSQMGLPGLWTPAPGDFCRVEGFPLLGSGKLDLRKVRDLALSFVNRDGA